MLGYFLLHAKLTQMTSCLLPWFQELLVGNVLGSSLLSNILISIDLLEVVQAHALLIVILGVHLVIILRTTAVMIVHIDI